jgi:SAM-dependent methyltransferase
MTKFVCNLCGAPNRLPPGPIDREAPSCGGCGSNVRVRGLLQALSRELFGLNLALPDFPRVHSLRGLGCSDAAPYAGRLRDKFDYRNTFYDREPRLDLTAIPPTEFGLYDFVLASEVFEHVPPPVEAVFAQVCRLLKPNGLLVLTVPYSLDPVTVEHFPQLNQFGLAHVGGQTVLVNRTADGHLEATGELVFHVGCTGPAAEMRLFSESGLRASLQAAGFPDVRFYIDDYPPFGIVRAENWSLPLVARRGPFALDAEAAREVVEQWRDAHYELKRLGKTIWHRVGRKLFRTGRKLGVLPVPPPPENLPQ